MTRVELAQAKRDRRALRGPGSGTYGRSNAGDVHGARRSWSTWRKSERAKAAAVREAKDEKTRGLFAKLFGPRRKAKVGVLPTDRKPAHANPAVPRRSNG